MMDIDYKNTPNSRDHAAFDQATSHLQDWSRELVNLKKQREFDIDTILSLQELNLDRNATYARLESMGLPTVLHRTTSLSDFLENSARYLDSFLGCKIRLIVEPHMGKETLQTIRLTDPSFEDVFETLKNRIDVNVRENYSVLIKEFIPFAYRVTAVVNSDQSILLEAANPASHSFQLGGVPDYHVKRDPFLGTFSYDFSDYDLRRLFYRAIMTIPHKGTGHYKEFQEGYYEMIIAKRNEDTPFQFYFDDYRRGKGFNL